MEMEKGVVLQALGKVPPQTPLFLTSPKGALGVDKS